MIQLKINDKDYSIRSNWNEVTFAEYVEIVKVKDKPLLERLSVYTGISGDVFTNFSLTQIANIISIVEFMDSPDTIMAFAELYESKLQIGEQPYWKMEKAKQLLNTEIPMTVAADIVELYTGNEDGENGLKINDSPVTSVIGIAAFFAQLSEFFERYKRLNDYKPSEDEIEAGLKRLSNLSAFGTPLSLARRSNTTVEAILKRPADECYMMLLYDFEQSEYEKRLNQIRIDNQAIEAKLKGK